MTQFLSDMRNVVTNASINLRPSHDSKIYPCGANECAYCNFRLPLEKNLQNVKTKSHELIVNSITQQNKKYQQLLTIEQRTINTKNNNNHNNNNGNNDIDNGIDTNTNNENNNKSAHNFIQHTSSTPNV